MDRTGSTRYTWACTVGCVMAAMIVAVVLYLSADHNASYLYLTSAPGQGQMEVTVNDRVVGRSTSLYSIGIINLRPGSNKVMVTARGYHPYVKQILARGDGEEIYLLVEMKKR